MALLLYHDIFDHHLTLTRVVFEYEIKERIFLHELYLTLTRVVFE